MSKSSSGGIKRKRRDRAKNKKGKKSFSFYRGKEKKATTSYLAQPFFLYTIFFLYMKWQETLKV